MWIKVDIYYHKLKIGSPVSAGSTSSHLQNKCPLLGKLPLLFDLVIAGQYPVADLRERRK